MSMSMTDKVLKKAIDTIYAKYDRDRSNTLDKNQLVVCFNELLRMSGSKTQVNSFIVKALLKSMDQDGDGVISKPEFMNMFRKLEGKAGSMGIGGQQQQKNMNGFGNGNQGGYGNNSNWGNNGNNSNWGNNGNNSSWGNNGNNSSWGNNGNNSSNWGNNGNNGNWGGNSGNSSWGNNGGNNNSSWGNNGNNNWGNNQQGGFGNQGNNNWGNNNQRW